VAFLDILDYAHTHQIDLIVMATHGRTGLAHALIGSVAEKVVRKAPCPVLTIKHPAMKFEMP
jgi:nucleotide-binding universal stress UspA family protein